MRLQNFFTAIWVLCLSLLSGCATIPPPGQFLSHVDSLAQTEASTKKRYVLLPGGNGVEAGDLQFQEFAGYIEKILTEKGFVKASAFDDAEIAIFLTYALGDPQTYQYSYSVPTLGQIGVASIDTYGIVSSYKGTATYARTTTYAPTYGITGSSIQIGTTTSFTRFLFLDAYDVAIYLKDKKMSQVWKTNVVSTGSTGDLRRVIPYMVTAMKPYLGTNTGHKIEVAVPADDPSVQLLRGGKPLATK